MKIPKKKELIELQRKYRTDKKIGEVYGVPARLVAYWRSKKRIGAYSFPKYSEEKIQELWDRFGDDEKAGAELNISRPGFRQWRRKYGIIHRPAFLKLEQLELPLPDLGRRKSSRRETIAQKILARRSGLKKVEIGEVISLEPDIVVASLHTAEAISLFAQLKAERIWNSTKVAVVIDQRETSAASDGPPPYKAIRDFVKKQKIREFYDIGSGVSHQLIVENARVMPGQLVLSSDPQAGAYGGIGAFSANLTPSEMASVWATGRIWLKVPETIKVTLSGHLPRGVLARDIILKMSHELQPDANYRAMELYGSPISAMSISERLTLTGSSHDLGFKSAIVPFDDITGRFLRRIMKSKFTALNADVDAAYANEIEIDINYLTPQVGLTVDGYESRPVEEVAGRKIDQVVIGCCINGRLEDLEIASRILRGRKISHETRAVIIPGSRKVYGEALERGLIRIFLESGCVVMNPGCGSCIEAHRRMIDKGERAISTAAWDCPGHRGYLEPEIYISSPATAAASAIDGEISDPRKHMK